MSLPWLRPRENVGALNIDFCTKTNKNSLQEVADCFGLICYRARSHSGETVISKICEHFCDKSLLSCVCGLGCFMCSGLGN